MHEVLVNRLGGLSLPRKSVVRLTDRPDMTLDVYRGRKTTKQQKKNVMGVLHCISIRKGEMQTCLRLTEQPSVGVFSFCHCVSPTSDHNF